ncbi:hypothetical protein REPUB_Repub07fG0157200 [Reevesia pubescens]
MVLLNRLPTKSRLLSCGLISDDTCVLCSQSSETRKHLFYDSPFSKRVWDDTLQDYQITKRCSCWEDELDWVIRKFRGKSLLTTLLKLAWNAYLYFIWQERNSRIYGEAQLTSDQVCCLINCSSEA